MKLDIINDKNKQIVEFSISNYSPNYYETYKKSSRIDINFHFWIPKLIKNYDSYIISSDNIQVPKNSFYIWTKQNNNSEYSFICVLNFFKKYKFSDAILINFNSDFLNLHLCLPSNLEQVISKFEKLFTILNEFKDITSNFSGLIKKALELKLILDRNENFIHLNFEFNFDDSVNEIQTLNKGFKKIISFIDKISPDFNFDRFELGILKTLDEILPFKIRFSISASNESKIKINNLPAKLNLILNYLTPRYLLVNHQVSNPYIEIILSDDSYSIAINSEEFFKNIEKSIKVVKFLNLKFVQQFRNNILLNQLSQKEIEFFYLLDKKFSEEFNNIENFLKLLEL